MILLSGDQGGAVSRFAQTADLENAMAEQSPEEKLRTLQTARQEGASVLMIGDGLNDAIALGAAEVSMSFAGATQIAQNVADVVIARADFRQVDMAVKLSTDAMWLIRQNLGFSLIYNLLAVPTALAGLLTPALAAFLMASSSTRNCACHWSRNQPQFWTKCLQIESWISPYWQRTRVHPVLARLTCFLNPICSPAHPVRTSFRARL